MYYFLPVLAVRYQWFLIAAAVIPALFLMLRVYRSDRKEKESASLLRKLAVGGVLCTLLAQMEERIGEGILSTFVPQGTRQYDLLLYFVVVAIAEETSKYIVLYWRTWRNPEFNCSFDGVVYSVFVSLGFALWENISYVLSYGFSTAFVRAVTAIPGHACFGVFMGVFYGLARREANRGNHGASGVLKFSSILVPVLLHGAYDYIASTDSGIGLGFLGFIAVLFLVSYLLVGRASRQDQYIR